MKNRAEEFALYIIGNKTTIRKTAKVYGVSKSTVHNDVSNKLKKINFKLYKKTQKILVKNFKEKHIRGGEATKIMFLKRKQRSCL